MTAPLTSPLGGDDLAKALRDAYGQGYTVARFGVPSTDPATVENRDAWIAQYIARLPAAEPIAAASEQRVGEDAVERLAEIMWRAASRSGESIVVSQRALCVMARAALASAPSPAGEGLGELERLREALRFYADRDAWTSLSDEPWQLDFESPGRDGHGYEVAEAALARSGKLVASTGSEKETKGASHKSDGGARILAGLDDALAWAKGDTSRGKLVTIKDGQIVDVADPAPAARDHVVSARLIPWEPGSLGGVDLTFESGLRVALPLSEPEAPSDAPSTTEADHG